MNEPALFGHPNMENPLQSALDSALAAPDIFTRSVAQNLVYEHHVSPERQAAFIAYAVRRGDQVDLRAALDDYFRNRVLAEHPDYLDQTLNSINILNHVNPDVKLFTLLDLRSLEPVFRWACQEGVEPFWDVPFTSSSLVAWIDDRLSGDSNDVETFVENCLDVLARFPYSRHRPHWVTTKDAFNPFVNSPPERWLEILGTAVSSVPRWIIGLCYTAREAGALVRPTQLDAGWHANHFPSPPTSTAPSGGFAMDLGASVRTAPLPEYIHRPIRHSVLHWRAAGRLLGRVAQLPQYDLLRARRSHYDQLVRLYGPEVRDWMAADAL